MRPPELSFFFSPNLAVEITAVLYSYFQGRKRAICRRCAHLGKLFPSIHPLRVDALKLPTHHYLWAVCSETICIKQEGGRAGTRACLNDVEKRFVSLLTFTPKFWSHPDLSAVTIHDTYRWLNVRNLLYNNVIKLYWLLVKYEFMCIQQEKLGVHRTVGADCPCVRYPEKTRGAT